MNDDAELLRRYAERKSEAAFAELVQRHLGLVYHAALRQCRGDSHRAQDVAQMIFTDLARKASTLMMRPGLAGWLYTSTRYAAAQAMRTERRRQVREQEVFAMNETFSDSTAAIDWDRMRPVIDETLFALNDSDREAVLLRFFEGQTFAEVGRRLSVPENTARVRVSRAVEKMQAILQSRGVTSTTSAVGLALSQHAGIAAPAGLAATVAAAALVKVSRGVILATATSIGATKLKLCVLGATMGIGATALFWFWRDNAKLGAEVGQLRQQNETRPRGPGSNRVGSIAVAPAVQPSTAAAVLPKNATPARSQPAAVIPAALGSSDTSDRLSAGDRISVSIRGEMLDVSQQIDRRGMVRLAIIDEIKLAGLTLREAERLVEKRYRDQRILKSPAVSIVITAQAPFEVSILGEVRTPGTISFSWSTAGLDIVEVITRAGGFTPRAKTNAVRLFRLTQEGKTETQTVDVEAMIAGRRVGRQTVANVLIYPGDRLHVDERLF